MYLRTVPYQVDMSTQGSRGRMTCWQGMTDFRRIRDKVIKYHNIPYSYLNGIGNGERIIIMGVPIDIIYLGLNWKIGLILIQISLHSSLNLKDNKCEGNGTLCPTYIIPSLCSTCPCYSKYPKRWTMRRGMAYVCRQCFFELHRGVGDRGPTYSVWNAVLGRHADYMTAVRYLIMSRAWPRWPSYTAIAVGTTMFVMSLTTPAAESYGRWHGPIPWPLLTLVRSAWDIAGPGDGRAHPGHYTCRRRVPGGDSDDELFALVRSRLYYTFICPPR